MQIRLLGSVDVVVDESVRAVPGQRRKAVLATLALHAGEVVSTDRLIDVVWGDAATGVQPNTLQRHMSYLRTVLDGGAVILARPPGYVLTGGGPPDRARRDVELTDLRVAQRLIARAARSSDPAERADQLRAALCLWRGPALADVAGSRWLEEQAERLEQIRLAALQDLLDDRLALGEHASLIPELESLAQQFPFHERIHGQLMLALYRAGRQSDALAAFQRVRRALADELGVDPGQPLRDLEAAVLRQDPALLREGGRQAAADRHDTADQQATTDRQTAPVQSDPISAAVPTGAVGAIPRQLPPAVGPFSGRAAELARLDSLLTAGRDAGRTPGAEERAGETGSVRSPDAMVIAAVSGTAGVGKTTLAVHWAHRVAGWFPDGQLYVNLRCFDPSGHPMTSAEALLGFLDALCVPRKRVPVGVDAQAALYRSVLAGKRVLVLLDNARSAEQVRPLLPGSAGCLVIVTSRNQLTPLVVTEGAHALPLDLLTVAEARDLLARRLGSARVDTDSGAVEQIITACARLPLALSITAAHAATRPSVPLVTLAAGLRDSAVRLDRLHGGDPASDIRGVFSWSYRTLSDQARELFCMIGLHPGPDLGAIAAASLAGLAPDRTGMLLTELVEAHLISEPEPGRYAQHDLLRAYAAERAHEQHDEQWRRAATRRLLDHYLQTAHAAVIAIDPARDPIDLPAAAPGVRVGDVDEHDRALAWFAAEHAALVAAIRAASEDGFDDHAWRLAWTMTTYFDWLGSPHDLVATQRVALECLLRLGDLSAQAHVHRDLGRTLARLAQYGEADVHLTRAVELYEQLDDLVGQGRTHHNLGWMADVQGRPAEALDHAQRSHRLFAAAGNRLWQARALNAIGWLCTELGDHELAIAAGREAILLLQQLGDRHGEAGTWDTVGLALRRLGDHAEAQAAFERSREIYAVLGDRTSGASVLIHLGDTRRAMGDSASAERSWRDALAVLEPVDHPDAQEARSRLDLHGAGHAAVG